MPSFPSRLVAATEAVLSLVLRERSAAQPQTARLPWLDALRALLWVAVLLALVLALVVQVHGEGGQWVVSTRWPAAHLERGQAVWTDGGRATVRGLTGETVSRTGGRWWVLAEGGDVTQAVSSAAEAGADWYRRAASAARSWAAVATGDQRSSPEREALTKLAFQDAQEWSRLVQRALWLRQPENAVLRRQAVRQQLGTWVGPGRALVETASGARLVAAEQVHSIVFEVHYGQ